MPQKQPPAKIADAVSSDAGAALFASGVVDAATSYEIDQQLRGGMLAELRLAFGGTLRRVKLEIDGSLSR